MKTCICILMVSLPFFVPASASHTHIYYEAFPVSAVFMHAAECLHLQVHGLLASVSVYAAITGGSLNAALGLQRDIGAQRD